MFEVIKKVIEKRDYELKDILYKINKMYIQNYITEEQKEELDNLARENAKPENSYAPLQEQIDDLVRRVEVLEKEKEPSEPSEDEEVIENEYPEYVQPLGSHDAYNTGDKISYNGKNYECVIDNCVWNPTTYPAAWQEITEDSVEEVIPEPEVPEEEENLTE